MKINELSEKLKQSVINRYKDYNDKEICYFKSKNWTGNELAKEVENETEIGIDSINMLLFLTIDLLNRGKIKADETK